MISSFGQVFDFIHCVCERLVAGRNGRMKLLKFKSLLIALFAFAIPMSSWADAWGWRVFPMYGTNENLYPDPTSACRADGGINAVQGDGWNTSPPQPYQYWCHPTGAVYWRYDKINYGCVADDGAFHSNDPRGNNPACLPVPPPPQLCKDDRQHSGVGNPCDAATGEKRESEIDLSNPGSMTVNRTYSSQYSGNAGNGFGLGWLSPFGDKRLYIKTNSVLVQRPGGKSESFTCPSSGICTGSADVQFKLNKDSAGYTLVRDDGGQERYSTYGLLAYELGSGGQRTSYTYDALYRVQTISGPSGHTLTLAYNGKNRVNTVTDSDGKVIYYDYDNTFPTPVPSIPAGNLTRARYPDGTAKIYHYENTSYPNHLTGISYVDAQGITTRYATYAYDATGKAARTEHADVGNGGAQERFLLNYDSDTQTTVTDPVNMQEVMTFSTNLGVKNLVSRVNQSDGKSVQQTFDINNNLTCKKDEENRVTLWSYNVTNQKLSQTEGMTGDCTNPVNVPGATRTTTHEYLSPTLDLPRFIRRPSVATGQTFGTELVYGDAGHPNLPTQIIQRGYTPSGTAVSRTVSLDYNSYGQVNVINGPRTDVSDVTTLEYNECTTGGGCGQLRSITNALGHTTTFDSYDAAGRLLQMTDANGLRTGYEYDARGRVRFLTQTPPQGAARVTEYRYNAAGDVAFIAHPDGRTLTYTYDAARKLRRVTDNAGNYVAYGYDLKGNRTNEYTYDPAGTLVRSLDLAFDLRNRLASINAAGSLTQQVHDAVGNLALTTDPNNNPPTTHGYDAMNRLIQTVNALGGVSGYGYDASDRLLQVTAPNSATTKYAYDDLGNLLQEVSPDRGTTAYAYDAAGNLTQMTDARGITVGYQYDALNRLTVVDYPGTGEDIAFTYDAAANCPNGVGRLCRAVDESGTIEYAYDAFGNVTEQRKTELSRTYITAYTYDAADRMASITYPDGRIVSYTRDPLGRIQGVSATVSGSPQSLVSGRAYRADGLLLGQTYGNGLNEIRQYDLQGRLTYQSLGAADTRLYGYDLNGNVTSVQSLPQVGAYTYDALDRLTRDRTTAPATVTLTLGYDTNGNRVSEFLLGPNYAAKISYAYAPGTNRLAKAGTTDVAGNTLADGAKSYSYNGADRLAQAYASGTLKGSYTYNHQGQRTRKVAGTTTVYHYDLQGNLILETSPTGVTRAVYVYVDDAIPLAQVRRSGTTDTLVYLHTDHEGTPRLATNPSAIKVWSWEGRAFGDTAPNQDPDGNGVATTVNLRYAGMYSDSETGLYYWGSRYYDPKTGRGISPDQMSVAEHVARWKANLGLPNQPPLEINPYVYVANNPLRWIDPDGHMGQGSGGSKAPGVNPPPFPNGNYEPGFAPQDSVCTVPIVGGMMNSNSCVLNCCKAHDDCYTRNGCNSSSWRGNYYGFSMACQQCNAEARRCVASAISNGCSSCSK